MGPDLATLYLFLFGLYKLILELCDGLCGIAGFENSNARSPLNILNRVTDLNGENQTLKKKLCTTEEFVIKKENEVKILQNRNGVLAAENQQLKMRNEIFEQQTKQQQQHQQQRQQQQKKSQESLASY